MQMNEVIQSMQVIKMYAWENAFAELISELRRYTNSFSSFLYVPFVYSQMEISTAFQYLKPSKC